MEGACCGYTTLKLPSQISLQVPKSRLLVAQPQSSTRYGNGCHFGVDYIGSIRGRIVKNHSRRSCLQIPQASKACKIKSRNLCACSDRSWLLKKKAEEVAPYLNGRCIFLVADEISGGLGGFFGSDNFLPGLVLADALGYTFVDSDKFIEEEVDGGTSVRQIFQQLGETFFRNYESETLRQLALTPKLVVATGGGAVIQPINWKYMKQGISVWLDVPLDALAKRIAAVGTDSRPLLDFDADDAYTRAFMALFTLSKKRSESYANADTTVSLQHIAEKLGLDDIADITPTAIAIEVLDQIKNSFDSNKEMHMRPCP